MGAVEKKIKTEESVCEKELKFSEGSFKPEKFGSSIKTEKEIKKNHVIDKHSQKTLENKKHSKDHKTSKPEQPKENNDKHKEKIKKISKNEELNKSVEHKHEVKPTKTSSNKYVIKQEFEDITDESEVEFNSPTYSQPIKNEFIKKEDTTISEAMVTVDTDDDEPVMRIANKNKKKNTLYVSTTTTTSEDEEPKSQKKKSMKNTSKNFIDSSSDTEEELRKDIDEKPKKSVLPDCESNQKKVTKTDQSVEKHNKNVLHHDKKINKIKDVKKERTESSKKSESYRKSSKDTDADCNDEPRKSHKSQYKESSREEKKPSSKKKPPKGVIFISEDSDSNEESKKFSIFDIVEPEPMWVSMYDKVKSRSCKQVKKPADISDESKDGKSNKKEKHSKKKSSTSWDTDSDSMCKTTKKKPLTSSSDQRDSDILTDSDEDSYDSRMKNYQSVKRKVKPQMKAKPSLKENRRPPNLKEKKNKSKHSYSRKNFLHKFKTED